MRVNVILLFGGKSEEYEISLRSAAAILPAFSGCHTVFPIGIDRGGRFRLTSATPAAIASDRWLEFSRPVTVDPANGFLADGDPIPADAVFPILHGGLGEGGGVAALCELLGIAYVGCPALAGALCMDKILTKRIAASIGVDVAAYREVRAADLKDSEALCRDLGDALGYPMFVKPASSGSSVGVHRVDRQEDLPSALADALGHGGRALCEEYIEGAEVELAILEEQEGLRVSTVGEIESGAAFYDYDAKYVSDCSRIFIPARIGRTAARTVRECGRRLFRELGCRGLSRIDFFVKRDGTVILNEVNTMPGFTDISMFPRLLRMEGLSLSEIIDILLKNAKK